jgi:hypothetical protein
MAAFVLLLMTAATWAAPVSEQIIVDQVGWRAGAPRKVAIFADPITGQNSAVAYTPGASFQIRRASDNATVFTGTVTSWNAGATQTQSGDKVWYGDFSSFTTPGTYYVYDPTNNLQSYNFKLDDAVYAPVLRAATHMFYYQRCGTAVTSTHGGNWNHPVCHEASNQDLAALEWISGHSAGPARDVHGGWHDAGDMNKYVPFLNNTLWDLMMAYEWNPTVFGDDWNIPESANGVPDILDEIKWEMDWLLRMQMADGSVCNRVGVTGYVANSPPNYETIARYYTPPTSWATATSAAHFAHASRLFAAYNTQYPGYSATLNTAAQNAWNWLNAHPAMTPSTGFDGAAGNGGQNDLAAAAGSCTVDEDLRLRIFAAAELFKTTGTTTYRTFFDTWIKDPSTADHGGHPLNNNWFDPTQSIDLNRACVVYATTTGATQALVDEIRLDLAGTLDAYLGYYTSGNDAYRGFMYDGHYCWGSNQIKAQWGNLFIYGIQLNVNPTNNPGYKEAAEEYLHYFHGRNPLSACYLSNMGTKGLNLGVSKSAMEYWHGWFCDGSALYDGVNSTYGPGPGYLAGGPNQYYTGAATPPKGEPPMKAYRDWNSTPDSAWEVTEPGIYYQAAYLLLLSQFSVPQAAPPMPCVQPTFSPAGGTYGSTQTITISTTTSGASIRYTTDGSTPSATQGTLYSGAVTLPVGTITLKAMAYKSGWIDSPVTSDTYLIVAPGTPGLVRDIWTNVAGNAVSAIPVTSPPSSRAVWGTALDMPQNWADAYGERLSGYLIAPTTGSYTFWICSDDDSELWLSTTSSPANKVLIGYQNARRAPGYQQWGKVAKSAAIPLTAGQKYYIEALHKDGGGADHCSVGWAKPGQGTTAPSECIPAASLSPIP